METPRIVAQSRASLLPTQPGDGLSKQLDNKYYSDRGFAIGMGNENNVVLIEKSDAYVKDWMLSHFQEVGLGEKPNVCVGGINNFQLDNQSAKEFHPFIFYPDEHRFSPNMCWLNIVKRTDDKNSFSLLCSQMGVPIPKTLIVKNKIEIKDFDSIPYPGVLKISTEGSFTGRGVFFFNDQDELEKLLGKISDEIAFQIQEDLRPHEVTYLNLQYLKHNGKAKRLKMTDQILGGSGGKEHIGNIYNAKINVDYYEAWGICDRIAGYMADRGIRNIFAFDVAVIKRNGKIEYLMIECNPRYNGSSTPTIICSRLNYRGPWVSRPFAFNGDISNIDLGDLAYNKNRKSGIVVHIASTARFGEISATIMARNEVEIQKYTEKLQNILS